MVARKNAEVQKAPEESIQYETPWKLLAVFVGLLAFVLLYGFMT